MPIMPLKIGNWNLVADLQNAILDIKSVGAQGNVTGTIQWGAASSSAIAISGAWSETLKQLTFSYTIRTEVDGIPIIYLVFFVGYLFQAGDPLFNASPGPVTTAAWNLLAGTWHGGLTLHPYQQGWVARIGA
jgi:hypothetical protein